MNVSGKVQLNDERENYFTFKNIEKVVKYLYGGTL